MICANVWLRNLCSSPCFCFTSIDSCSTSFYGEAIWIKHSSHPRTISGDPYQPSGFPILVSLKPYEAWSGLQDHTDRVTSLYTGQTGQTCNVSERDSLQNKCSARTTTDSVLETSALSILPKAVWQLVDFWTSSVSWRCIAWLQLVDFVCRNRTKCTLFSVCLNLLWWMQFSFFSLSLVQFHPFCFTAHERQLRQTSQIQFPVTLRWGKCSREQGWFGENIHFLN